MPEHRRLLNTHIRAPRPDLDHAADRAASSPTAAVLDSQSIKSSEGGQQRGFDAGKKTTGRKRHLVVDVMGLLLVVMVSSASVQDRAGGRAIQPVTAFRMGAGTSKRAR